MGPFPGALLDELREAFKGRSFHEDAFETAAHLARVAHRVAHGDVRRRLQVGVGEDNKRILAAQLQHQAFETGGRRGHDGHASFAAADEADHVDVRLHQGCAAGPVALHEFEYAFRQEGTKALEDGRAAQGHMLAGLEHNRVARRQGRYQDSQRHAHGEVPGRDGRHDPVGFTHQGCGGVLAAELLGRQGRAHLFELLGHMSGVGPHLAQAVLAGLAHLPGDQLSQLGGLLTQALGTPGEQGAALFNGKAAPGGPGGPGPGHGGVDLGGAGAVDLGQALAGGRIQIADGFHRDNSNDRGKVPAMAKCTCSAETPGTSRARLQLPAAGNLQIDAGDVRRRR